MVSDASRASSAADLRISRRAVSACVTASLARLIAAPWVLRSSGDILPSVASSAEIEPFLPRAATRTASSAASSPAAAIWLRVWDSSWARSVMAIPFGQDAKPRLLARHGRACPGHLRLIYRERRKTWMPGTRPGRPTSQTSPRRQWGALRRQRGLGFFSDRLERRRFVDGEVRQHL